MCNFVKLRLSSNKKHSGRCRPEWWSLKWDSGTSNECLRQCPLYPKAYQNRAVIYYELGDYKRALADAEKAREYALEGHGKHSEDVSWKALQLMDAIRHAMKKRS